MNVENVVTTAIILLVLFAIAAAVINSWNNMPDPEPEVDELDVPEWVNEQVTEERINFPIAA